MSSCPLTDDDLLALMLAEELDPAPLQHSVQRQQAPASFSQQRLWLWQQVNPNGSAYNLPRALRFKGALSIAALEAALLMVVERHSILRTRFVEVEGVLIQQVVSLKGPLLQYHNLAEITEQARERQLNEFIQREADHAFDLQQAPLLRCVLLRLKADEHVLLLNMHHIVSDAWSNPILLNDLLAAYERTTGGDATPLLPLPVQYADYADWQRNVYPQTKQCQRAGDYWRACLAGDIPALELPTHRRPEAGDDRAAGVLHLQLPASLVASIQARCEALGLTPFVFVFGAWQLLLARYSGQDHFAVGVPNAGRNRADIQGLVGYFVNTQIYPVHIDPMRSGIEFLQALRRHSLAALEHAEWPMELLAGQGPAANSWFQTLFNWRTGDEADGTMRLGDIEVEFLSTRQRQAKFDLSVDVDYLTTRMNAVFEYRCALFTPEDITRLGQYWLNLLQCLVDEPGQRIASLRLLSEDNRRGLLKEWNPDPAVFAHDQCLHQLIEAQVDRAPQAVAVSFAGQRLTYGELNTRANRLAHKLRELGVGAETPVGLAVERSLDMVVAILAILKAGGGYVPLDPHSPPERLAYMATDSGIRLLLTHAHLQAQLPFAEHITCLPMIADDTWLADYSSGNPSVLTRPDNLAYVIYTSGSTGKPKGTLIPHHNVTRLFQATRACFDFNENDVWTVFHSCAFDFSVWELFGALVHGGRAVIVAKDVAQSADAMFSLLHRERVTVLNQTPTAFAQLIPVLCAPSDAPSELALRYVVFGGEALDVSRLKPWFAHFGDARPQLVNMYGITETTVHVTWRPLSLQDLQCASGSPIGRVIADLSWALLDNDLSPSAPGTVGELHIGGAGLARGYHRRPGLTAERFVPDPFDHSEQGGARLYRSGDLARYAAGSGFQYAGRIDHQVKIRGFRIETGEIEARLLEHPQVVQAVVLAIDGPSGKQLVGYLVADPQAVGNPASLADLRGRVRESLKATLPDYMVPTHLMCIDALPLTANGKLDRNALPAPDQGQLQSRYEAPISDLEQQVAAIWADVLKIERIGRHDNFFESGGHSLLAAQVVSRIRKAQHSELSLRTLFEAPVLADFVAAIAPGVGNHGSSPTQADRSQPLPLSYAQQRQWFLWQLDPQSAAYNIPMALKLRGALDHEALRLSFEALIARHEILRTTVLPTNADPVQVIHPPTPFVLAAASIDAALGSLESGIEQLVRTETLQPFDLERGPLLRVKLVQLAVDEHLLILTLHHIVTDGWSMPILVDELLAFYQHFAAGQAIRLPALPLQYADFAVWQRHWMDAGERQRQLAYWRHQLGDRQPILELPLDRVRPSRQDHAGASLEIDLDEPLAQGLKQVAREQGVTLFMLLLASFQTLLHRYSRQQDIRVGVPIAGRGQLETERLIGFFVNTQVFKAEFDGQMTFNELLQQVRHTALAAQAHQDLPFEQLVDALQPQRSLSHRPLFQVMFNHQVQASVARREVAGLTLEGLTWEREVAQFDLTLNTFEHAQGIGASMRYSTALFDRESIESMAAHWTELLRGVVADSRQRIGDLALLGPADRERVVTDWNRTQASFPQERSLQSLIERQVAATPQATAVVFGGHALTYRQLNQRANQLAHKLRECGVGPDVLVGVAAERSVEMVVALLGILKAGGAYVPLDPEYPAARLTYMIEDSSIRLLLTQAHLLKALPVPGTLQCLILQPEGADLASYSADNPCVLTQPNNLAYVIYTSGSTGRPKGAGNSHLALVNRLWWMQRAYALDASDVVLQKTPFSFDVSVWEFFWPLLTGARLVVAQPGDHRDPQRLVETIRQHDVTTLHFVPSMLQAWLSSAAVEQCGSLQRLICSGEALAADLAQQAQERLPQARLYNLYGPTEAAIDVTHWTCLPGVQNGVPIGRPIDNLKTHILDDGMQPMVPRASGELYLGGIGLARGYHQRPALTAERFVPDPHDVSEQGGGRLYRTGDLARYRADGVIEYQGRIDHQVKIRGLRIELGEIEARLQEHASVREAVVVDVQSAAGTQLAAYLVSDGAPGAEPARLAGLRDALRGHLKAQLPDYMVPVHMIFLDGLPLSPNGKLDRKALPAPDSSQLQKAYTAPQSDLEQQVAAIWAEVLSVEPIGRHDDFFESGGHSLLATQAIARCRQVTGVDVSLRDLFEQPTLADFVARVDTRRSELDPLQTDLAKSLEALKRLTMEEIDDLIS